ncbi:MAG: DUF5716 family protein [Acetatifactor sp.]|nr:DUF5716 family protein [Acetatifactor sp.]
MGFLNSDKVIVGYDLGNEFTQISFSFSETGDVETLSQAANAEHYNIPTVLCKRNDTKQWLYGKEAVRCGEEHNGIQINNLLDLARKGEPVTVDGESIDPVALLTLFFKRSLGRLTQISTAKKIKALMITCEVMDYRTLEVLKSIVQELPVKADKISYQSHAESFFSYVTHQPRDVWGFQTVLFSYQGNKIKAYRMECNKRTTPVVAYIQEQEFPFFKWSPLPEDSVVRDKEIKQIDGAFLYIAQEFCQNHLISSVFLIGDGFDQEWMKESLKFLCRGRRVFQGTNLYSKGACFGMQERLNPGEVGKNYVFLGNDKLKANIGMKVYRQGEESYYALLDAGMNWYEAECDMDLYIRDGNELNLTITPLTGRNGKIAQISLEDFPADIARLNLKLYMDRENILTVEITDRGFGEFREPSGRVWREEIELY